MKHPQLVPLVVAAVGAWSPDAFAQRQQAVGPGIIPLNATGVLGGVDMSASGTTGTLAVGVPGGPQTDIYTLNTPTLPGLIAVGTAASSQGNIVFNSSSTVHGAIGQTQPAGPFLLDIAAGQPGSTVNFLGPVYATRLNVTGTGAVNFDSGSINITATNFAGDGFIGLGRNSTLIGALTTTAGANTGTLALSGGSMLDGAVGGAVGLRSINVVGGSNAAGVTAGISGAVDAYAFSLGTNTLNIGGALTIANGGPGGVINTTLASPTVYGNIRPLGATNLGPTLLVNVNVPSTAFIPVGTQFNIVQTQTGTVQSGTDGSVVRVSIQNPTNPLYTFSAVPVAGTTAGLVAIRTTGIPLLVPVTPPSVPLPLPPTLPVAVTIVPVLVAIAPVAPVVPPAGTPVVPVVATPSGPVPVSETSDLVVNVLAPINALSDGPAVVNAVTQLAPSATDQVAPLVTFQGIRQFQALWQTRLNAPVCGLPGLSDEETASCSGNERQSGMWLNGFGNISTQNARGAFDGYDATIAGTMLGYDTALGPNTRAGVGLGYARSTIRGNSFDTRTNSDSYIATAYIGHEAGPWYVNGAVSYGWNEYSSTRPIVFPGVNRSARADYNGENYTAFATTGYNIDTAQGFRLTPLASLQYTRVNIDGFTETGAGDINLTEQSRHYDFLESGLGAKIARPFTHAEVVFVPEVHARWLHALQNPALEQTASFRSVGSASFTTPGLKPAEDTLNAGAGLTLLSCACSSRNWSVEAVYDFYGRNDGYTAHQGMVRLSGRF